MGLQLPFLGRALPTTSGSHLVLQAQPAVVPAAVAGHPSGQRPLIWFKKQSVTWQRGRRRKWGSERLSSCPPRSGVVLMAAETTWAVSGLTEKARFLQQPA